MKKILFAATACLIFTFAVTAQQTTTSDEKKPVKRTANVKPKTAVKAVKPVAKKKGTVSSPSKPVKVTQTK